MVSLKPPFSATWAFSLRNASSTVDAQLARELAHRGARVRRRSGGWRRCVGDGFSPAEGRRGGGRCRDGRKHRGGLCRGRVLGFRGGLCWRRRGIFCLFKDEDGTAL